MTMPSYGFDLHRVTEKLTSGLSHLNTAANRLVYKRHQEQLNLCPFALHFVTYRFMPDLIISRIFLVNKTKSACAGHKVTLCPTHENPPKYVNKQNSSVYTYSESLVWAWSVGVVCGRGLWLWPVGVACGLGLWGGLWA